MTRPTLAALTLLGWLVLFASCAPTGRRGPYQSIRDVDRNTVLAESLTRRATEVMEHDPAQAESLLRDALTADVFYGPAHNNLGILLLRAGDLAGAANEFQHASKLLPDSPDPRINLAIAFERAGRVDDAMDMYATVLEVRPDHVPAMQAMALCQVKHARRDGRTAVLVREIALRGETPAWREWAQAELSRHSDASQ